MTQHFPKKSHGQAFQANIMETNEGHPFQSAANAEITKENWATGLTANRPRNCS